MKIESISKQRFSEQKGTIFTVLSAGPLPVKLELIEVADGPSNPNMEQFALRFLGPLSPALVQGMHEVDHERLGSLDLFLVPLGANPSGMRYEAVFNRWLQPQPEVTS